MTGGNYGLLNKTPFIPDAPLWLKYLLVSVILSLALVLFDILFNDTVKARYLDKELSNRYVPRGNRRKVRAQMAIYDYLKSLEQPD